MRVVLLAFVLSLFTMPLYAADTTKPEIKVYHDPDCQCCRKWIAYLKQHDFTVIDQPSHNMSAVKDALELPRGLASCHTAVIDGYVIEGHVPANDILKLLTDKPDIAGLSVPKMPVGTPGMEVGDRKAPFIVFQFNKAGKITPYNRYTLDDNNQYQQNRSAE